MTDYSPTILYVDDDTDQRIFVAAILEYRGFRVQTARSALNALELISTERFDAVVVDYGLLDMSGAQLAQEIRAREPFARIILLSGRAHLPPGELAYVDLHIVKGSLLDTIVASIWSLLDQTASSTGLSRRPREPQPAASQVGHMTSTSIAAVSVEEDSNREPSEKDHQWDFLRFFEKDL